MLVLFDVISDFRSSFCCDVAVVDIACFVMILLVVVVVLVVADATAAAAAVVVLVAVVIEAVTASV